MRKSGKTFLASTVMLAGVALATLVAHSLSLRAANNAVAAALAAWPGATAGAISADPFRGQVVLTNVALNQSGVHVTADRLVLPMQHMDLAFISSALALEGNTSADNLTIETGFITYAIKHLEARGTSMSAADLAGLLDSKSTVPASQRFAALNAAAISMPEVIGTVKLGEISETLAYHDVKLVNIVNGKIGAASVATVSIAVDSPKSGPMQGVLTNLAAKNMDLVQSARLMTETRKDGNEPVQTIYDSFSADGFVLKGVKDVDISFGKISGLGFKARAMATPYGEIVQKLGAMGKQAQPTPEQLKDFAAAYADMIQSFEFAGVEMRDMAVAANPDGKPVAFKLARMAVNGLSGGKLGEVIYEGFAVDAAEAKFKLGSFSFRGFDFRPLLAMASAFAEQGEAAMSDPAEVRKYVPTIDHIGLSGLDVDVPAGEAGDGNASGGKRVQFQLGNISLDASAFIVGVPTATTLSLDHFKMDMSGLLNDPGMKDFAALGYNSIDVSSKLDLGWDEASSELRIKTLSLDSAGMGSMKASATFSNVPKGLFSPNLSMAMGAAVGAVLTKAEIAIVNQGLLDKAMSMQAAKTSKPVEEVRKGMIAMASTGIPAMLGNAPAAKIIGDALAKFLADPKSLRLTATSATGLGAGDIGLLENPAALLKKIEVKASVNN